LLSGSLRYASFDAHSGRGGLFFPPSAHSVVIRGYSCPLKPNKAFAHAHRIFKRGQPPLSVCARLRVARVNRAVTFFASFHFVFLPALSSGLCRVSLWSFRYAPFSPLTPQNIVYPKQEQARLNHSIPQVPFHSFGVLALALPAKKLHCTAKKTHQPGVSHVGQPQP
jgi:hypothetical protein